MQPVKYNLLNSKMKPLFKTKTNKKTQLNLKTNYVLGLKFTSVSSLREVLETHVEILAEYQR